MVLKKKKAIKKGFKNLVPDRKPQVSDFPRPRRKELMQSILKTDDIRLKAEFDRKTEALKNVTLAKEYSKNEIVLDLALDTKRVKNYCNAFSGGVPSNTSLKYELRQPIKVPPNYEARLRELDKIGRKFERSQRQKRQEESDMKKAKLKLEFNPQVSKMIDALKPSDFKSAGKTDIVKLKSGFKVEKKEDSKAPPTQNINEEFNVVLGLVESLPTCRTQSRYQSRQFDGDKLKNIDLRSPVNISNREQSIPSQLSQRSLTSSRQHSGNGTAESRTSRNVPYMLEIWKKSENNTPSEPIKESEIKRIKNTDLDSIKLANNLPPINSSNRAVANAIQKQPLGVKDETKEIFEEIIDHETPHKFKSFSEYPSFLSDSTLDFLRRISRENFLTSSEEDEFALQKTITGFDPKTGKQETIEATFLNTSVVKKTESPFKNMTPGTSNKIGSYITDDGDLVPFETHKVVIKSDHPFELLIPVEPKSAEIWGTIEKEPKGETQTIDPNFVSSIITERLVEMYGKEINIPVKDNDNFYESYKPIKIGNEPIIIPVEPEISFKELIEAIKSYIQKGCDQDQRQIFTQFLESNLPNLKKTPEIKTNDWNQLFKFLVFAIRINNQLLVHESVCMVSLLGAESQLLRWDMLVYKNSITEILNTGTKTQKYIASMAEVRSGNIDSRVIQQVWLGLGEFNNDRRRFSLNILSKLDTKFADSIVKNLERDSVNPNWRIRLDITMLLKCWILKLEPPMMKKPVAEDPDALDTDDAETKKALFHTFIGGTGSVENLNIFNSGVDVRRDVACKISTFEEETKYNPEFLVLYEKCIELLLTLMSNDWSVEVRSAAAKILGELKQGKAVVDWIAQSLDSPDPVKRGNSLKSLSLIGVLIRDKIPLFLKCLKDPFASVRIEACRFASKLKSNDPVIINNLMDLLMDSSYKARAYCVKALGVSNCNSSKVRENLNWSLQHDTHPAVRSEAIWAVYKLGFLKTDAYIREGVLTLLVIDKSEVVRQQAEKVLVLDGIIYPGVDVKTLVDGTIINPYPHILQNKSDQEIDIYLRKSLIEEEELSAVIAQVHQLSTKDKILDQLMERERMNKELVIEGLDLDYGATFKPITHIKRRRDPLRAKKDRNNILII